MLRSFIYCKSEFANFGLRSIWSEVHCTKLYGDLESSVKVSIMSSYRCVKQNLSSEEPVYRNKRKMESMCKNDHIKTKSHLQSLL